MCLQKLFILYVTSNAVPPPSPLHADWELCEVKNRFVYFLYRLQAQAQGWVFVD